MGYVPDINNVLLESDVNNVVCMSCCRVGQATLS
jgi:hypothetical protein